MKVDAAGLSAGDRQARRQENQFAQLDGNVLL